MVLNKIMIENEKRIIENILRRGLTKKVLVSNKDDEVLESDLDYNINILTNIIISLIEVYGEVVKVTGFFDLKKRCIFLCKENEVKSVDYENKTHCYI